MTDASGEALTLTLPSEVSIDTMLRVIDKVRDCQGPVTLSGKNVDMLDTSGLQILISIAKTQTQQNLPFALNDASEKMEACCATFGVNPQTMEPAA